MGIRLRQANVRGAVAFVFSAAMLAFPVPCLALDVSTVEGAGLTQLVADTPEPSAADSETLSHADLGEGTEAEDFESSSALEENALSADLDAVGTTVGQDGVSVQDDTSEQPTDANGPANGGIGTDDEANRPEGAVGGGDAIDQSDEVADSTDEPTSDEAQGEQSGDLEPDVLQEPTVQAIDNGLYELTTALGETLRLGASTLTSGSVVPKTMAANNAASQRWLIEFVGSGFYTLKNVATGTYLQASATTGSENGVLAFGKASGSEAQQWSIVEDPMREGCLIVWSRAYPDMVLHVASASNANGSIVQLCRVTESSEPRWGFGLIAVRQEIEDGFYVIENKNSGLVLDITSGSLAKSANVQQYPGNKTLAQTFKLTYSTSTGYYTIANVQSGMVVDVSGGRSADGTNIQQYPYNGTLAQLWCIKRLDDGSFGLFSSIDGRSIAVKDDSKSKGGNIQTFRSTGSSAQKWALISQDSWLPGGTYEIVADTNVNNAVSMGKSIAVGGKGITVVRNSSDVSARWQLVWLDGGYVRLINLGSGYVLTVENATAPKGAQIAQRAWSGSKGQMWRPVFETGGIVLQSGISDGVTLDIRSASNKAGAVVQTYTANGTAAQRFHLVMKRAFEFNTPYVIRNVSTRSGVIDIKGGSSADGAVAQLYKANSTTAQTFVMVDAGSGLVRIRNVRSEKYLALDAKGTGVLQVSGQEKATKWHVQFDASIDALRIEAASGKRPISASSGLSKPLRLAGATTRSGFEGFVLGVDEGVLVDKTTGKAARSKRVSVSGRGWLWADSTCKLHACITVDVPYVNQYDYGATMGCEGAALYMCLRQAGYCKNVTFKQFLNSVVRSPNGNPNLGFVGSVWRVTGNVDGVLPKGAVFWANKYATGHNVSGIGATGLINLLSKNTPVAVWVTPHFRASYATKFYGITVPNSWHCVTLTGYDPKTNKLRIADPASDAHIYWVTWDTFFSKWNMGQNAVTVS